MSRILEVGDKSADLPVAWARSREEAIESELDLLAGHPGRIDPVCVGHDAPYGVGDLAIFPEIGVVAERGVFDARVGQDFATPANLRLAQPYRFMDDGFGDLGSMRRVHLTAP